MVKMEDKVFGICYKDCKGCEYCKTYYHGANSKLGMFTYSCTQHLHHVEANDCSSAKKKEVK